jgi:hypothetical protein
MASVKHGEHGEIRKGYSMYAFKPDVPGILIHCAAPGSETQVIGYPIRILLTLEEAKKLHSDMKEILDELSASNPH